MLCSCKAVTPAGGVKKKMRCRGTDSSDEKSDDSEDAEESEPDEPAGTERQDSNRRFVSNYRFTIARDPVADVGKTSCSASMQREPLSAQVRAAQASGEGSGPLVSRQQRR